MHVGALVSSAVAVVAVGTLTTMSLFEREGGESLDPPNGESMQIAAAQPVPMTLPATELAVSRTVVKSDDSRGDERQAIETPSEAYWAAVRKARESATRFGGDKSSATSDLEKWQSAAQTRVPALSVDDAKLAEVVQMLELFTAVRISPSQQALESAEDLNVKIDLELAHPHDLGTILDIVLGFLGEDFMWYADHDGIRVISRFEPMEGQVTFEHSIADLLVDPATFFPENSDPEPILRGVSSSDELIVFLQETTRPGWWEVHGVSMESEGGTLRVTHLPVVHQEIQEELDRWREIRCPLPEDGFPGQAVMIGVSDRDLELIKLLHERPVGSILAGVAQEVALLELLKFLAHAQSFDLIVAPQALERMGAMTFVLDAAGRERTISTSYLEGDPKGIARAEVQWNVVDNCVLFRTSFEDLHSYVRANFDVRDLIEEYGFHDLEDRVRQAHMPWWDQDPRTFCRLNRSGVLEIENSPLVIEQIKELLATLRSRR